MVLTGRPLRVGRSHLRRGTPPMSTYFATSQIVGTSGARIYDLAYDDILYVAPGVTLAATGTGGIAVEVFSYSTMVIDGTVFSAGGAGISQDLAAETGLHKIVVGEAGLVTG